MKICSRRSVQASKPDPGDKHPSAAGECPDTSIKRFPQEILHATLFTPQR